MAKPRKPGTTRTTRAKTGAKLKSDTPLDASIEDAEVVKETLADDADASTDKPVVVDGAAPVVAEDAPGTGFVMDEGADSDPATSAEDVSPEPSVDSNTASPHHDLPQPVAVAPAPPPKRGGFMPLFLGGVIAAVIGAGALYYSTKQGWIDLGGGDFAALDQTIGAQSAEIAALKTSLTSAETEIAALRAAEPDFSGVTAQIDGVATVADGASAAAVTLANRLDETDARLDKVATQPIPEAKLPESVTAAYEAKFTELQAALEQRNVALQAEQDTKLAAIETRLDERLAVMSVAENAAAQAEQAAIDAATAAETRAALADINVALDTGAPFGPAIETLTANGTAVPETLASLADGSAPTMASLQASFPEAARAALVASTRAGADDGSVGGVTAFFRTQLGARSLQPREGADPDAVLSRAENAVNRGDLDAAIGEIATLPEAGQAALADWISRAGTRISATAALAALTDQPNSN